MNDNEHLLLYHSTGATNQCVSTDKHRGKPLILRLIMKTTTRTQKGVKNFTMINCLTIVNCLTFEFFLKGKISIEMRVSFLCLQGRSQGGFLGCPCPPPPFVSRVLCKRPTIGGTNDMKIWWVTSFWHRVIPPLKKSWLRPWFTSALIGMKHKQRLQTFAWTAYLFKLNVS